MVAWLAPAAFTLATAAVLLSCGGGSVRTTPLSPLPSATLIPIPSATPVTVVEAQTVGLPAASAGATPAAVQLPAAAGFATTLFLPLPQTAANAQLTTLVSNFAPAASPPFSLARTAAELSRAMSLPRGAGLLLYVDIYSSAVLALPAAPGFTLTVPPADVFANANYYLALFDPTRPSLGWQYAYAGPATAGGGSALALTPKAAPFTLAASLNYSFALYVIPQGAAQPTPAPSIAPTTVPSQAAPSSSPAPLSSPSPVASPSPSAPTSGSSVSITITVPTPAPVICTPSAVVVALAQTVSVGCSEAGYGGAFALVLADPALALVTIPTPLPVPSTTPTAIPSAAPSATALPSPTPAPTATPSPAPHVFPFTITGLQTGTTTLSLTAMDGGVGSITVTVNP